MVSQTETGAGPDLLELAKSDNGQALQAWWLVAGVAVQDSIALATMITIITMIAVGTELW